MLKIPKTVLLNDGIELMNRFCQLNNLKTPEVLVHNSKDWNKRLRNSRLICAFYRKNKIEICLERCAHVGLAGQSWSYPGYPVDRTPYGVILHELGHHVDLFKSKIKNNYFGDYSKFIFDESGLEEPITNYCPDVAEWFAEMFKLFLSNPNLLQILRPNTYKILSSEFDNVIKDPWDKVLDQAPERTLNACKNKIKKVLK